MWMIRIGTLGSSALLSVVTARTLGPGGRGMFALPAIDASIAVTFSVGLSSAASYYLLNRKAGPQIIRSMVIGFIVFTMAGCVATILTALICRSPWAIASALTYMGFYAGYSIVCGYYFGRDRARTAGLVNGILSLVTLIVVTVSILRIQRSPETAINAWVLAVGLVAIVGLCFVVVDARNLTGQDVEPFAVMRFGAKAGLLNVANLLNYRVDIYIVAMLLPVATVGLYTIAVTGAESALSLTLAVGQATLPRIGGLDRTQAGIFAARCLRNTVFFAAILCAVGMLAAPLVVGLLFGHAYTSIVTPMRILLLGIVAASTGSIVSNYFMLNLGRTEPPLMVALFSTVLCAGISLVMVPRVGMLGAAAASSIAYAISQTVAIAYFCKVSGIRASQVLFVDRRDLALYGRIARRAVRIS